MVKYIMEIQQILNPINLPDLKTSLNLHGPQNILLDLESKYYAPYGHQIDEITNPEIIKQLIEWKKELSPKLISFIKNLEGNSSFMCYAGVHRSRYLAELALKYGKSVVSNLPNYYQVFGCDHFGIEYVCQALSAELLFFKVVNGDLFLGGNQEPTNNLIISVEIEAELEYQDLKIFLNSLSQTPAKNNFQLHFINTTETGVDILLSEELPELTKEVLSIELLNKMKEFS